MVMPARIPWLTPGRVEWRVGGGVKTVEGPGVMNGCLATCNALMTTADELWYLEEVGYLMAYQVAYCINLFGHETGCIV